MPGFARLWQPTNDADGWGVAVMMESASGALGVDLSLGDDGSTDLEEREHLSSSLRRELLDLDGVETVEPRFVGKTPVGARAVDPVTIGAMLVVIGKTAGALQALTTAVRAWIGGQPARTVKLAIDGDTLEITGASSADEERLVTAWIDRH